MTDIINAALALENRSTAIPGKSVASCACDGLDFDTKLNRAAAWFSILAAIIAIIYFLKSIFS